MKQGIELFETIQKILTLVMLGLFVLALIVPACRFLFFIACGVFFIFPLLEQISYYYHKWFYRNIEVAEFFLDEDADTWEKTKWRILKVIPFRLLNVVIHQKYIDDIENNYKRLLQDKSIEELNKFLNIDKEGRIPYLTQEEFIKAEESRKAIEYHEEGEEDEGYMNNKEGNEENYTIENINNEEDDV